jgi:hypothetical protein
MDELYLAFKAHMVWVELELFMPRFQGTAVKAETAFISMLFTPPLDGRTAGRFEWLWLVVAALVLAVHIQNGYGLCGQEFAVMTGIEFDPAPLALKAGNATGDFPEQCDLVTIHLAAIKIN